MTAVTAVTAVTDTIHRFFVTSARGLVPLVAEELRDLGARSVGEDPGGCRVRGPLEFGYKICLWSRCATRVLLPLSELVADDADALYAGVTAMPWEDHISPGATIAVEFVGRGVGVHHTKFGAQKIKDAIADRLRGKHGQRPDVDLARPDVLIHAYARGRSCTVSIDLAGSSLHRRGYRKDAGQAPIKENLAACMLRFAKWNHTRAVKTALLDPCCGAGTLVIEAAMIAADLAPGLHRERFGFEKWRGHDAELWARLTQEAHERAHKDPPTQPLVGLDHSRAAIKSARDNAERAGVARYIDFRCVDIQHAEPPADTEPGLVIANPPFGERLGEKQQARQTFTDLGQTLSQRFEGWQVCAIATDDDLLPLLNVAVDGSLQVNNGPLEARVANGQVLSHDGPLHNRLRKNGKRLAKWIRRENIEAYRLYDQDVPEYAAAIDVYGGYAVVQEYAAPAEIDPDKAAARRIEIAVATASVLGLPSDHVFLKERKRQRGSDQYEREEGANVSLTLQENGHRFRVNLGSYLDTGLFLDHRKTRELIAELAPGKRFLNLFAYTGTVSVYAAKAGAKSTTTVDLSNTYIDWAETNFELNGIKGKHLLVRSDVLQWLDQDRGGYDLAFVDPPTFSNSKAMRGTWDVQRDHLELLRKVVGRMTPKGTVIFSTNSRKFKLDPALDEHFEIEDITAQTTPPDFARRPLHKAWKLQLK